jgi:hypothetical protein
MNKQNELIDVIDTIYEESKELIKIEDISILDAIAYCLTKLINKENNIQSSGSKLGIINANEVMFELEDDVFIPINSVAIKDNDEYEN